MEKECRVCGKPVKGEGLTQWIIDKPFKNFKKSYFFHESCLDEVTISGLK